MNTISLEELQEKINRGDDFHLVMTLGKFAYEMMHIPGSISIDNVNEALNLFTVDDEIIVYCSNPSCIASQAAYATLVSHGYKHVSRFAGGIEAWYDAGLPVEGTAA